MAYFGTQAETHKFTRRSFLTHNSPESKQKNPRGKQNKNKNSVEYLTQKENGLLFMLLYVPL